MEAPALPPDFDPWSQSVIVLAQDGTLLNISMDTFNVYRTYGIRVGINYGTQIGASILLLLVLLLLTRSEKRRSSLFIMNTLCLFCNAIRCILASCFLTGSMSNTYTQLVGDWSRVTTSDLATVIAGNTMHLVVSALVMVSLSLQVRVVCVTTKPSQRFMIMGVTSAMALISIGFKFSAVVISNTATLKFEGVDEQHVLVTGSYATQAAAILLYSCVFTWKLGHAIVQRRRLNMPQFGPLQIIFIMGCQTMVVPGMCLLYGFLLETYSCSSGLLSIMQFSADVAGNAPEIGTQILTVVCIFLPLSAIWAGVVNESSLAHRGPDAHRRLLHSDFGRTPSTSAKGDSTTAFSKSGSDIECSYMSSSAQKSHKADDNIYVDREFCVRTEDTSDGV
jgi:pheromone alpha factor receptor